MGVRGPKAKHEVSTGPISIILTRPPMADYQTKVLDSQHKYIIMACATKTGKSICLAQKALEVIINGGRVIWIASTFKRSGMVFDQITKAVQEVVNVSKVTINRTTMCLDMAATNGSLAAYSGDSQLACESAMGDAANLVVIDEASRCHESAWTVANSVTTATGGQVCVALNVDKSPKVSWAVRMFAEHLNNSKPDPDFLVLSLTAEQSPYIKKVDLERARKTTPARIFNALYNNIIPKDDEHGVFNNFEGCISGQLEEPKPGRRYVIGCDPARSFDYTVLAVVDTVTRRLVGFERYHGISWQAITQRILDCASKWNKALVVLDSTAQATLLLEVLQRHSIFVEPFYFTSKSKPQLVEKMMVDIEQRNISFPNISELIYEMQHYSVNIQPNGYLKYCADDGFHDDCITALMLANWKLKTGPRFDPLTFRAQYAVGHTVFGNDRDALTVM